MAWELAWDPNKGKWYYQDRETGQAVWDKPAGCDLEKPKGAPAGANAPEQPESHQDLPPGWQSTWDPTHKRWYYFNRETMERSWQKPSDPYQADIKAGPDASADFSRSMQRGQAAVSEMPANRGNSSSSRAVPSGSREFASTQVRAQSGGSQWDAESWKRRLEEARRTGSRHAVKRVYKEVAENNYALRINWDTPRTMYIAQKDVARERTPRPFSKTSITFSNWTTADAMLHFARDRGGEKVCALNFANGKDLGGGYKTGAQAQEEDLCRRIPNLYSSLFNAKRENLYPYGPGCGPKKYSDVLWTPGLTLARASEVDGFDILPPAHQVSASLVSAAAPNLNFADPPDLFDVELLYQTLRSIFIVPRAKSPEITTIVLGAWGCGAFGGDPKAMSELFCKAISEDKLGTLYQEVHFAIPSFSAQDGNATVFKETMRNRGISVRELPMA